MPFKCAGLAEAGDFTSSWLKGKFWPEEPVKSFETERKDRPFLLFDDCKPCCRRSDR